MDRKKYRWCVVPRCGNTSVTTPNKIYIDVPRKPKIRKKWLDLARRKCDGMSVTSPIYFCEDHFDLPNDMKNYMRYHVMGFVNKVMLKPGSLPSRFQCQTDRKSRLSSTTTSRPAAIKRQRLAILQEALEESKVDCNTETVNMALPITSVTVMSAVEQNESAINADGKYECRSCLQSVDTVGLHYIFQSWSPGWGGMESTMAEDLAKIANIQISETDRHSKFICLSCSEQLKAACQFISLVQNNDKIQRLRYTTTEDISCKEVWPKPIQIEKTIALENWSDVDVKQEVLSEHEYDCNPDDGFGESDFNDQIDIKVEPEEIVASESKININGNSPTHSINNQNIAMQNGDAYYYNDEFLDENVKEEPLSDTEDMELAPGDLPLECLLCARSFLSVSGLKAHVIAQHSYKTVKRKMGDHSPQKLQKNKYICAICKRSFSTMTDVMVHETCHNKEVCYGCNAKFDTFDKLSAHRKRCKALKSKEVVKPKTLDDVIRPKSENAEKPNVMENKEEAKTEVTPEMLSCDLCSEKFSDSYYLTIHKEIHHYKEDNDLQSKNQPVPMEVEALENIFEEDTQCNKQT